MTLGTMESLLPNYNGLSFSDLIIQQTKDKNVYWDLTPEAPLFDLLHPRLIKALIDYQRNPQAAPPSCSLEEKYVACYPSPVEALKDFPQLASRKGFPCEWFDVQSGAVDIALLDFESLGAVVISSTPIESSVTEGIHLHLLPIWISYASSPDLWSSFGKWPRFHERLLQLFQKYSLLQGSCKPGFYPLDPQAQKLEKRGFKGAMEDGRYTLTFPWTFPLSALKELERVISQEF